MGSKILLVEGDASAGADLRAALVEAGFSVTLVRDGQLGLARAVSEPFDAVIVSAELPGINGFRLCHRIRKDPNVSGVRVFIVGADAEDVAAHARLPTRADSYFEKPLVVGELIARMRLHGVGEAPATLREEIATARKELALIAELQRRVVEQEALVEATTRELAKARADIARLEEVEARAKNEIEVVRREADEALRAERRSGLAALERAKRELTNQLSARDQTHTQDIVMATRAIAKLRSQLAERDQRLAARTSDPDDEARWSKERAGLEERLRMADARADESALAVVTARAEIETLKQRLATAEAQEAPSIAQLRALEASLVSRTEAMATLERRHDEAMRELAALEAEIVVLRSELMSVRRQLDTAVLQERTSDAQLERGRDLLDRAEALVSARADET